ncbi:type 1 periplasmic-binding domain-containing protein [Roseomonas populi]|uniref:Cytochrome c domain-containing protein n=1 Tax=Roseomonas populi TaxID=3121582 RepID=A0ABT1X6B9_9PROT|nr:hypothetical protein [Roseomonas pecuniae]MCR0983638.1 hypothetical protein [Roseomonas pecuniae]
MRGLTALSLLLLPLAGAVQAGPVEDGEALFTRGARPGAPPPQVTTAGGTVLPATALPCAGCHGRDGGGGQAEAGLRPPPIVWSALSRPASLRPSYDEPLLLRAVVQGTAAGGRTLDAVMPRYGLSLEDGRALAAYLRALDGIAVPGVEERSLRVALLLPPGRPGEAFAAAFEAALEGAAPDGVFGRRVTVVRAAAARARDASEEARRLLDAGVLALVSALPGGVNEDVLSIAAAERVPVLSARAGLARPGGSFALLPGAAEEAIALLRQAGDPGKALIVAGDGAAERRLAASIADRVGDLGEAVPPIGSVHDLPRRAEGASAVLLLLGPDSLPEAAALLRGQNMPLLVPGAVGGSAAQAAAAALGRPVLAGFGVPPEEGEGMSRTRFAASGAASSGLTGRLGHAAGEVLVEALRRAGRRLTRERLVAAFAAEPFEPGSLPQIRLVNGARPRAERILVVRIDGEGSVLRASDNKAAE